MDDTSPPDPDDDLAALDFYAPVAEVASSDLDALGTDGAVEINDEELAGPTFSVTNPPGTVTVLASTDGGIQRVELSRTANSMTEADLADEIVVIAGLATQDARAAQYASMLDGMRRHGHDDFATRDFLSRDLDLPSPDDAVAARAHVFATRYVGEG